MAAAGTVAPVTVQPDAAGDLELAHRLADIAAAIALPRWRALDLDVRSKPDMSPVSDADTAVETAIRAHLARVRPDDAVLGEEGGGQAGGAGRRWIIDPIDGTRNFVRGNRVFATLVALEVEGRVDAAVVSAPALQRRWWAARGAGAHAGSGSGEGEPIRVSGVGEVEDAVVSSGAVPRLTARELLQRWDALALRAWHSRGFGDFWQHMLVAEGAVDVALDVDAHIWDYAPLRLIVEEAGGRFTDLEGVSRHDGADALSTNGLLHEAVLAALAG